MKNKLGYKKDELLPGSIYKEWSDFQISKKEAIKALKLGYFPRQWRSPKYQNYKEKKESFFLAKLKLSLLEKPSSFRQEIESSETGVSLTKNVINFQKKIILDQAVEKCFKPFVNSKLLLLTEEEITELEPYLSQILKGSFASWKDLELSFKLLNKKNLEIQIRRSASIKVEDVKNQVKTEITRVLEKVGIESNELNLKYQDWAVEIEKAEDNDIAQLFQLENHLATLLEEINYFLQQDWLIELSLKEMEKIKKSESTKELWKIIQTLIKEKEKKLLIEQFNKVIEFYQKLQGFTKQKYDLQINHLKNAQHFLEIIKIISSNLTYQEAGLLKNLKIALNELEYFKKIKKLQKSFSKNPSLEDKMLTLQELQKNFQNLNEIRVLDNKELQIQTKVKKNLDLIQNKDPSNSLVDLLPIINSTPQISLSFIAIEDNSASSSENASSNQGFSPDFQKWLIISIIGFLALILVLQLYRKKKEADPFW